VVAGVGEGQGQGPGREPVAGALDQVGARGEDVDACVHEGLDIAGELALQLLGVGGDDGATVVAGPCPVEGAGEQHQALAGAGGGLDEPAVVRCEPPGHGVGHLALGGAARQGGAPGDLGQQVGVDPAG
jgi:hypothetical protein